MEFLANTYGNHGTLEILRRIDHFVDWTLQIDHFVDRTV